MNKCEIRIPSSRGMIEFVRIAIAEHGSVKLTNGGSFCVNGKSILGVITAMGWHTLYCVSDNDMSKQIEQFIVNQEAVV